MYDRQIGEIIEETAWSLWLDDFLDLLRPIAETAKSSPLYYVKDEVRCRRHSTGFDCSSHEQDSQRYCEKCGKILEHCFTDYGVREEIGASAESSLTDPIAPEEAFTLLQVIDSGTPRTTEKCGGFQNHIELRSMLMRIEQRLPPKLED